MSFDVQYEMYLDVQYLMYLDVQYEMSLDVQYEMGFVKLNQWLWIMLCYVEPVVVNI